MTKFKRTCPECGSHGPFTTEGTTNVCVKQDGSFYAIDSRDLEIDNSQDTWTCDECDHHGNGYDFLNEED